MRPSIRFANAIIFLLRCKTKYSLTLRVVIGFLLIFWGVSSLHRWSKIADASRSCKRASYQAIRETIYMNGLVNPSLSVNLTSEKTGKVSQLLVKEGAFVRKGQVVALLDSRDINVQIQNKARELMFLKLKYQKLEAAAQRIIALAGKDILPPSDIEEAQASVYGARADLARSTSELVVLNRDRESNVIRSPYDGTVAQIFAFPGTFVSPMTSASDSEQSTKSTIMQIYSHIQVVLNAPEATVFDVLGSSTIFVSPSTDSSRRVSAHIDRVMPYVILTSSKVSAIPIRLDVADQRPFLPGMNVDVEISKPPVAGLAFPEYAVLKRFGRDGVLRCGAAQPAFVPVNIKGRGGGFVVVRLEGQLRDGFMYSTFNLASADKPGFFDIFRVKDINQIRDRLDVNPLR